MLKLRNKRSILVSELSTAREKAFFLFYSEIELDCNKS